MSPTDLKTIEQEIRKIQDVNPKVFIFGKGWMGNNLHDALSWNKELNVENNIFRIEDTDLRKIEWDYNNDEFDRIIVINAAAKTNTRRCETHRKETIQSNVFASHFLYSFFDRLSEEHPNTIHYIHYSTGCIYDGNEHYIDEHEKPQPQIFYTKTKADAEEYILECMKDNSDRMITTIIRPRMPFEITPIGNNIAYKAGAFTRCIDEPNSMSCVTDVTIAVLKLINAKERAQGIFNIVNSGYSSAYKIATEVWNRTNVELISKERLDAEQGLHLTNTLLNNRRILEIYPEMPSLKDRLCEFKKNNCRPTP